jgi:hypothetical protein
VDPRTETQGGAPEDQQHHGAYETGVIVYDASVRGPR